MSDLETCPDCGVVLSCVGTGAHAYLGASASCWALYGEVLAREYADPAYFRAHRLTVDAYCAQHPGGTERRTIQSINVHLAGLHAALDRGLAGDRARDVIAALTAGRAGTLRWLDPPRSLGTIRVDHVRSATDADDHEGRVRAWARSVWDAWADHHDHVARMVVSVL